MKIANLMHRPIIGYRYEGVFYLKKLHTTPVEFEEIRGSVFMRSDLVSWLVEHNTTHEGQYYRTVYKKPIADKRYLLTKNDATVVY